MKQKTWVNWCETGIWEDYNIFTKAERVKHAKIYLRLGPKIIAAVKHNIKVAEEYIEKHMGKK